MKIVSPDILHKTEVGVKVGINSAEEASAAYSELLENANRYKSDARIEGVQVQQMLPSGATEDHHQRYDRSLIWQAHRFGLGGILVEVLKDVTFRLAPLSKPMPWRCSMGLRPAG